MTARNLPTLLTLAAALVFGLVGQAAAQQPQVFAYANITTDATTTLKSVPGYLHTVCINTPAATGTITIYDNTAASGTKIGTITKNATSRRRATG
jgi:hypothetical protein